MLEPILFLLYINDLPQALTELKATIFADDTSVFFKHKNPIHLEQIINKGLQSVSQWLMANKLSLNTKKSHFLVFKKQNITYPSPVLKYLNIPLEEKSATKYLGIRIDNKLTWDQQLSHLCSKISQGIGCEITKQQTVMMELVC